MAAARPPRHPRHAQLSGRPQAAAGSWLAVHSAAKMAGVFMPSAECGRRWL